MDSLTELAIIGFKHGSDNFGEKMVGVSHKLYYSKITKSYEKVVHLVEPTGSPSTSGIGFYEKPNDMLEVVSGHAVMQVFITPELREELKMAETIEL